MSFGRCVGGDTACRRTSSSYGPMPVDLIHKVDFSPRSKRRELARGGDESSPINGPELVFRDVCTTCTYHDDDRSDEVKSVRADDGRVEPMRIYYDNIIFDARKFFVHRVAAEIREIPRPMILLRIVVVCFGRIFRRTHDIQLTGIQLRPRIVML